MIIYVASAIFFAVGVGAMWSAVRHARTSSDVETGRWFTIGLMLAAASAAVAWFTYF